MAENNQAQDRYNAPRNIDSDFETFNFDDLPVGELFWLTDNPSGDINVVHRKINDKQGMNLKTQVTEDYNIRRKVYQKT
tara:strand:+ start:16 stop:252 length:237 start_codon:yes stop_codon:yes gene_type:complete